mgnify:CR=1 FL=1
MSVVVQSAKTARNTFIIIIVDIDIIIIIDIVVIDIIIVIIIIIYTFIHVNLILPLYFAHYSHFWIYRAWNFLHFKQCSKQWLTCVCTVLDRRSDDKDNSVFAGALSPI